MTSEYQGKDIKIYMTLEYQEKHIKIYMTLEYHEKHINIYMTLEYQEKHKDIHDFRISGKTHKDKNSICTFAFVLYSYIICLLQFRNFKIVYRRYAGLYFCICVDVNDNNLAYLEAIHNFVEVLNEYFHNVCELDLVFNFYKVKWCIELLNNF